MVEPLEFLSLPRRVISFLVEAYGLAFSLGISEGLSLGKVGMEIYVPFVFFVQEAGNSYKETISYIFLNILQHKYMLVLFNARERTIVVVAYYSLKRASINSITMKKLKSKKQAKSAKVK